MFLMFTPGQSTLLSALLDRAQEDNIYVRGVVSQVRESDKGDIVQVGGEVVKSGSKPAEFHDDVLAEAEFDVHEMMAAHIIAIVHSKVIVIDPFSEDCAVVTGSHNFSDSASQKNDENLTIIRGNKTLAQAYAVP